MDDIDTANYHEVMELLQQMDQKIIFKKAFDYVKSRTNKDIVTIGDVLGYFANKYTSKDDKFYLGWTAINMIHDRQKNMNMPDEHKKILINKIFNDIFDE